MKPIYATDELDAIVKASLEFKKTYPNDHFAAGNLGGMHGLSAVESLNGVLTRKMKYVASLDLNLLQYLGLGTDHIEYFETGPSAEEFLNTGGFKGYFEKAGQAERINKLRSWAPILISFLALIVAVLSWTASVNRNGTSKELRVLQERIDSLEVRQAHRE